MQKEEAGTRLKTTVVLVVGKEGVAQAAVLCSLLGDDHVLRIVQTTSVEENVFVDAESIDHRRTWRFHEQKSAWPSINWWKTHVGLPDSLFPITKLDDAISGKNTFDDDGAVADIIILCCGGGEQLNILFQLARSLDLLDKDGSLLSSDTCPLLIGTLGPVQLTDWFARIAFASVKSSEFQRRKRSLAFFGLSRHPFVSHVVEPGLGVFFVGQEKMSATCCPSLPSTRRYVCIALERVLQRKVKCLNTLNMPSQHIESSVQIGDTADPYASLSFLHFTLHNPNPIVDSCLLYSLLQDKDVGLSLDVLRLVSIRDLRTSHLSLLIIKVVQEWKMITEALDDAISPVGYHAVSKNGGILSTIIGDFSCQLTGNDDIENDQDSAETAEKNIPRLSFLSTIERLVQYKLHNDPYLSSILFSPFGTRDKSGRFLSPDLPGLFNSAIPYGMCNILGLGELLGFDLCKQVPETLKIVRFLQERVGKEFVDPSGCVHVVGSGCHISETASPQAFGINTLEDLKRFLRLHPTGFNAQIEDFVPSPIVTSLNLSKL